MFENTINQNLTNFDYQPNQKILEYQQRAQIDIVKEQQMSCIRMNEVFIKNDFMERKKTEQFEERLKLKEAAKERERSLVEVLEIGEGGELWVCTQNTLIEARPRSVSNLQNPSIIILQCMNPTETVCYMLTCKVGCESKNIYLASEKLAQGNYLLGKLTAAGIYFTIKFRMIKPLMLGLIGKMIESCENIKYVPESVGWIKWNDKYYFFSEEETTWKTIKKLSK